MNWRDQAQKTLHGILHPVVRMFIRLGISPNAVTTLGLGMNFIVAVIFIYGAENGSRGDLEYIGWGGLMILCAGAFDMLDGQVARMSGKISKFGALYDSVLDRYSELFMFLGICYYLVAHHYFMSSIIAFVAMIGSVMVSYTRARAEGLGIPCKEGFMQRPERVIVVGLSAILCGFLAYLSGGGRKWQLNALPWIQFESISVFTIPLTFVAIFANYTAVQRLMACHKYVLDQENRENTK